MNSPAFTKRTILLAIVALAAASGASAVQKLKTKSNQTNERAATEAIAPTEGVNGAAPRTGRAPIKQGTLQIGTRSGANGMEVAVALSGGAAFAWSPTTGAINPVPADNLNPNTGIGVVVKKNPGSSAARTLPVNGNGSVILPADMEDGRYDMTVSVPRQAVGLDAGPKARAAGMATFALILVKNPSGFALQADQAIHTKGSGAI